MSWLIVTEEDERRQREAMEADLRRYFEEAARKPKRTKCPCCGAVSSKPWEDLFSPPVIAECPNMKP